MPRIPAHLGTKATALWRQVIPTYTLRPDELRILEDSCREVDLIERLEKELRAGTLWVKGSTGQEVANPLISEIRQHRTALKALLVSLHLPDELGAVGPASTTSSSARAAAQARWRRGA